MVAREVIWAIICVGSVDWTSVTFLCKEAVLPWPSENFLRIIGYSVVAETQQQRHASCSDA